MKDVISWIKILATGHQFYIVALVALGPLFFMMKKRRLSFLLPIVMTTVFVLTPFFYNITNETVGYYWRILWILPVIPLCAAFPCAISEKIKEKYFAGKVALIVLFAIAFVFLGTFIYGYHFGSFEKPTNAASKLPKEAVEVADFLLSLEDNPHVVVVPEVKYDEFSDAWTITGLQDYIRQYTGKIKLLYGRVNYIFGISWAGGTVYNNLMHDEGDLGIVAQVMLDYGYSYLVVKEEENNQFNKLELYGFKKLGNVSGYSIYRVFGNASERRDYNKLGQVTEVTYIDKYGNKRTGSEGYSTIKYEYDWNGNIVKEFRTDKNGIGITNGNGYSGWEREYDFKCRYITERQLGQDGMPITTNSGYYELRKDYGFRRETISYYDKFGKLVILPEGYSSTSLFYNNKNLCIKEKYYDTEGKMCLTDNGYAEVCREYDDRNLCVCEKYFDENEEPLKQEAGYFGKSMEYDEYNRIATIKYLDSDWVEKDRIDGFSRASWVDNESTGSRDVVFYNTEGELVSIDGINLVNGVHYRSDGWSKWMTPQMDTVNSCFNIGTVNLGPKKAGDLYTCFITVELFDVSVKEGEVFRFWTQGTTDGGWDIGNVWNLSLIGLNSEPEDGIYCFRSTVAVDEDMERASEFCIGFRCDNWASGSFRVKDVMILKGKNEKEWSPGL